MNECMYVCVYVCVCVCVCVCFLFDVALGQRCQRVWERACQKRVAGIRTSQTVQAARPSRIVEGPGRVCFRRWPRTHHRDVLGNAQQANMVERVPLLPEA